MEIVFSLLIAIGAGVGIGVLSGLLGIGGGTLMVPLFRLGFSLEAVMSTATSLFCILPTACAGAVTHIRNKTCLPRVGVAMGVGGAICSPLGAWLANMSPSLVIMLVMAAILIYSSTTMIRKALSAGKAPSASAGEGGENREGQGEPADAGMPDSLTFKRMLGCAAVGAIAGFFSGFVGVGGGFIMVPLMVSLFGLPMSKASGTSLIAIGIIAIPGIITQAILGNIDFMVGIAVALGSIPGAYLGARLVKRISEKRLRLFFSVVLVLSAIVLVVNELGSLA